VISGSAFIFNRLVLHDEYMKSSVMADISPLSEVKVTSEHLLCH